jgi:hypothetical protein
VPVFGIQRAGIRRPLSSPPEDPSTGGVPRESSLASPPVLDDIENPFRKGDRIV